MCTIVKNIRERGVVNGMQKGLAEGQILEIANSVYEGDITLARGREKAMLRANMSQQEFDAFLMKTYPDFNLNS